MLETLFLNNKTSYLDHLNTIINFDINNESEIFQNSNTQHILNELDLFCSFFIKSIISIIFLIS
jgi:hypothetical protein